MFKSLAFAAGVAAVSAQTQPVLGVDVEVRARTAGTGRKATRVVVWHTPDRPSPLPHPPSTPRPRSPQEWTATIVHSDAHK